MTTLVVGCGYLGLRVARRLGERGDRVFGTVRTASKARAIGTLGVVKPVVADVLDAATLRDLPSADRVLYCVGFDRSAGVPMRSVYVDGLRTALDAMAGRFARLVYVSSTGVFGRNDGGWVDEDSTTEPTTESGRVCLDAEDIARGLSAVRGFDLVVVRYSGLYGPDRIPRRASLVKGEPIVGDPSKFLNLIHLDDAASAAVAALDLGRPGRLYLGSDDRPVQRSEYYALAAALLDAPPPQFDSPAEGSAESRREAADKRVSNRRIKDELGLSLSFPDIAAGLPDAFRQEAAGRAR